MNLARLALYFLSVLHRIEHKEHLIMTQLDDLNAAQAQEAADLQTLIAGQAAIQAQNVTLQQELAALQAANPAVDLTAAIAAANALDATIKSNTVTSSPATP